MKKTINTVKDLRNFLSMLIKKDKTCGDEKIKFYLHNDFPYANRWLKLKSTCRGGLIKETIMEFEMKKGYNEQE